MTATVLIDTYVNQLRRALRVLPPEDRDAIVQEIRAHLEASAASGTLDAALSGLGPAQRLARQYADELRVEDAYVHGGHGRTFAALATLASRRTLATVGLVLTFVFYALALTLIVSGIADLFFPDVAGVFTTVSSSGSTSMSAGVIAGAKTQEHLGLWYTPLAIALGVACFILAQTVGQLCLGLMRRPTLRFTR